MLNHKNTVANLALKLDYGEKEFLEVVKSAPKYYAPFHMVSLKKDGSKKTRHIDNPHKKFPLRALQNAINKKLLIPEIPRLDRSLAGGIKKRSMLMHIEPHIGKKTIVCMDLSNCFPNISYKRIVEVWKQLGYSPQIARILASATTFRGYLPQGAPTSSLLCNFAMNSMAIELRELMEARAIDFTQYIDDICFSGDDDKAVRAMMNEVYRITPQYEQHINRKKNEIMDSKHQQKFMGIVVNIKTKVDEAMVRKVVDRIKAVQNDDSGFIDSFTNLSIGGQILHIKKYDSKNGDYLEKLFNNSIQKVYDGGSKPAGATIETCWDYRTDKTRRIKCRHLIA